MEKSCATPLATINRQYPTEVYAVYADKPLGRYRLQPYVLYCGLCNRIWAQFDNGNPGYDDCGDRSCFQHSCIPCGGSGILIPDLWWKWGHLDITEHWTQDVVVEDLWRRIQSDLTLQETIKQFSLQSKV